MKRYLTAIACAASFGAVAAPVPNDAAATLAAFHAALAGGEREQALSYLAPQAVIYESGFVERSREEYAAHHLADDIRFARATSQKVLRQDQRSAGDTAVIWQETETSGAFAGKPVQLVGATTAVLEKTGERWTIVHLHWSSRKAK